MPTLSQPHPVSCQPHAGECRAGSAQIDSQPRSAGFQPDQSQSANDQSHSSDNERNDCNNPSMYLTRDLRSEYTTPCKHLRTQTQRTLINREVFFSSISADSVKDVESPVNKEKRRSKPNWSWSSVERQRKVKIKKYIIMGSKKRYKIIMTFF